MCVEGDSTIVMVATADFVVRQAIIETTQNTKKTYATLIETFPIMKFTSVTVAVLFSSLAIALAAPLESELVHYT